MGDTTARMLDWSLPGGQDLYFKAVSELAAGGGFIGEKVTRGEHELGMWRNVE
jgi:hypothetical protein